MTLFKRTFHVAVYLAVLPFGNTGRGQAVVPANLTFTYQRATDPLPIPLANFGSVTFPPTSIGLTSSLKIFVTNNNPQPEMLSGITITDLSGKAQPTAFTVTPSTLRLTGLFAGGALTVNFSPTATGVANAAITFQTLDGSTFKFTLSGTGVAPQFVLGYSLADGNQVPLADGTTIAFPTTQITLSSNASISIANQGTGPGTVIQLALSGNSAFKLTGLPLLPAQIASANTLHFNVVFTPTQSGTVQGTLQVTVDNVTYKFGLSGSSSAASFAYQVISGSTVTPVATGGTIAFPQTSLSATTSVTIQVINNGTAPGAVNSVNVGTGPFQAGALPVLPVSLAPGASTTFTINFTPVAPGAATGRLIVDQASFSLTGTGLGPLLVYSLVVGGSTTPLVNGGTASFPNTPIGSVTPATITIQNNGNVGASINGISIEGNAFGVTVPATPIVISPGSIVSIPVSFGPVTLGTATGTVRFDTLVLTLTGFGTTPPPLPSYTFTSIGDTAAPLNQPFVGLTLSAPYPLDITGTLTLTFASDSFGDDTSIQFASGGRIVSFKIPATSTAAVFGSGPTSAQFQAGTVAGVITLTPAFTTSQVSITPLTPPVKTVVVRPAAPTIRNVQIGTRTGSTFEVQITGYSTTRSATQLNLQFTAAPGAILQPTSLSLNAEGAFSAWYQSAASNAAGGQFTAFVTVSTNGRIADVQSVAATVANALGTSNSMSVALQ